MTHETLASYRDTLKRIQTALFDLAGNALSHDVYTAAIKAAQNIQTTLLELIELEVTLEEK